MAKFQIFCIKCQEPDSNGNGFSILFNKFHLEKIICLDHICCSNRIEDSIDVETEQEEDNFVEPEPIQEEISKAQAVKYLLRNSQVFPISKGMVNQLLKESQLKRA